MTLIRGPHGAPPASRSIAGRAAPVTVDVAEAARLEAEYLAENQRVAALLAEKGFGMAGDEL